jgi:selenide,water dikinase
MPLIEGAEWAARKGYLTRGETGNLVYLRGQVEFESGLGKVRRSLLLDPQTSGGLLFFVAPDRCDDLVSALRAAGTLAASVVGVTEAGEPGLDVRCSA